VDVGLAGVKGAQALTMGDPQERALGQSVAVNLTNKYRLVQDENLNRYVTMVAQVLLNQSKEGGEVFVGVLDTDSVNAYSGPNGYVLVTRGALRQMRDESELAGVIAHEIEHIIQRHGLESAQTGQFGQAVVEGTSAGLTGNSQQFARALGPLVNGFVNSQFSQGQERSADAEGVRLAARAGYDPNGLVRFLQRLNTQGGANLFPSHPSSASRVQDLTSEIQREGLSGTATNKERFEAAVRPVIR
jgi:predicted Zn-dependent protease